MAKLEPKQLRFCEEYLVDLNATAAAIRAGYSKKTATELGYQLLQKPHIKAKIDDLKLKRSGRTEITADIVLRELLLIAKADIAQFFKEDGSFLPLHQIPEIARRAIAGIEVDELFEGFGKDRAQIGYTKKLKFWDKTRALEMLGRHLKLFRDQVDYGLTESLEHIILNSLKEEK